MRLSPSLVGAVVDLLVGELAAAPPALSAAPPRQDLRRDLFLGAPGLAVFWAAHARSTGDSDSRERCLRTLAPCRLTARAALDGRGSAPAGLLGALVGVSSTVYALLVAALLLDEPELLAEAHQLTAAITPRAIRADTDLDVVFGSAGAILVLLALDRHVQEPNRQGYTPLALASLCGAHLLANGKADGKAGNAGELQSGFSHGASGALLALARLAQRTGEPALWAAVGEGAASERPALERLARPAADASSTTPALHVASWCHGAAGIALARSGILAADPPSAVRAALEDDLGRATEILRGARPAALDHLCCGNLGRADALLHLGGATNDERLVSAAHALALWALRAMKTRGSFALDTPAAPASLLRGLPGIGYALLRLLDPGALPNLLLFDSPDPTSHLPGGTADHAPSP